MVAVGVPVREAVVVPTAAQLRRQRRELRSEFAVAACMRTADAISDTLPSNSVLLCFATLGTSLGAVGAIVVQELGGAAAGEREGVPFVTCVQLHIVVWLLELLSTGMSVLVGNAELCLLFTDGRASQRHRLCVLGWLLLLETTVLLPIAAPRALAVEASIGGACEVDTVWMALGRAPTPAHALTALATTFYFAQRMVTIGTGLAIFVSIVGGIMVERPLRGVTSFAFFVGVLALGNFLYNRRFANALVFFVAAFDRLVLEFVTGTQRGSTMVRHSNPCTPRTFPNAHPIWAGRDRHVSERTRDRRTRSASSARCAACHRGSHAHFRKHGPHLVLGLRRAEHEQLLTSPGFGTGPKVKNNC